MDEQKKIIALTALAENFGKSFSPELLNLWLNLLSEHSAEAVQQAVVMVIKTYKFLSLPPFAVLQDALDEIAGESQKCLEAKAISGWENLLISIQKKGSYNKPTFLHRTEHALRVLGGWEAACQWKISELGFKRRDFVSVWVSSNSEELLCVGMSGGITDSVRSDLERLLSTLNGYNS